MNKILELKWTVSRARDSYGYNILTLTDEDKKYRTCGGGYDLQGTVFGKWLWDNFSTEIKEKVKTHEEGGLYGFHKYNDWIGLDGVCGLSSMIEIANAIGLTVKSHYDSRKRSLTYFSVYKEERKDD